MKKVLVFILIPVACFAQPEQLMDFESLFTKLKSGETVKAVIHYSLSKLVIDGKEEKAPDAIGGMEFHAFEYFAKGAVRNDKAFISVSETVLITHPRYGYVLNYVKLRIFEDNSLEIIARYLDPRTYEVRMDETFYSEINNGQNNGAVYLYVN
jgi:hypothetical protein